MFKLVSLLALATYASAGADWHSLSWYLPSGSEYTQMSGDLVVPSVPDSGTTYVWPGLQPTDGSGVYQNVLNQGPARGFASGWCCSNPSLPWGNGFDADIGATVTFNNVRTDDTDWTSTVTEEGNSGDYEQSTFPLGNKTFNEFLLAIEQYDVGWTFGPVYWSNIYLVATGTDSSWCNDNPSNYNGATDFTISGISSSVVGNTVQCTIQSVTFNSPIGTP